MKKTLYVIKKLGFGKSTLYLFLYPLRFLREAIKKLDDIHDEIRWHSSLHGFIKNIEPARLPALSSDHKKKIASKYSPFKQKMNEDWFRFYFLKHGSESIDFIPDNVLFRAIIPALNNMSLLAYYEDKNHYGLFMGDFRQPRTLLRYIRGRYYDENYSLIDEKRSLAILTNYTKTWIIKPSCDSGGGRNIYKGTTANQRIYVNSEPFTLSEISSMYKEGFIIQERIYQADLLAAFHPHSLNTFRIITLRLNNKIHLLSAIVKFGTGGNTIDNSGAGGVWCGITKDGYMKKYAFSHNEGRMKQHPESGLNFERVYLPFFDKAVDFAKKMHHCLIQFDLVSWDIAINKNSDPVFIECNLSYQGTINSQIANGPLFGDLTDDVLAEVLRRRNANRA